MPSERSRETNGGRRIEDAKWTNERENGVEDERKTSEWWLQTEARRGKEQEEEEEELETVRKEDQGQERRGREGGEGRAEDGRAMIRTRFGRLEVARERAGAKDACARLIEHREVQMAEKEKKSENENERC